MRSLASFAFFFFNDTATTEIYTLSLHDALPISRPAGGRRSRVGGRLRLRSRGRPRGDRESTRLNSSHQIISYAVFCLKKKKIYILAQRHRLLFTNCERSHPHASADTKCSITTMR